MAKRPLKIPKDLDAYMAKLSAFVLREASDMILKETEEAYERAVLRFYKHKAFTYEGGLTNIPHVYNRTEATYYGSSAYKENAGTFRSENIKRLSSYKYKVGITVGGENIPWEPYYTKKSRNITPKKESRIFTPQNKRVYTAPADKVRVFENTFEKGRHGNDIPPFYTPKTLSPSPMEYMDKWYRAYWADTAHLDSLLKKAAKLVNARFK